MTLTPVVTVVMVVWAAAFTPAHAEDARPPGMLEQLLAQYKLAKLAVDGSGQISMVEQGTALVIQKAGLEGLPVTKLVPPCAFTYARGKLKRPGFGCLLATGMGDALLTKGKVASAATALPVGMRAYPAGIKVDAKAGTVRFSVVACEGCDGGAPPAFYKALVEFRFPGGTIESADAGHVEDVIGEVFPIDSSGAQAADAGGAPSAGATGGPPPTPVNVRQGQTIEEVERALGRPGKILNAGAKTIYVYPDLKIVFVDGRVLDVQ